MHPKSQTLLEVHIFWVFFGNEFEIRRNGYTRHVKIS